jgi:sulfatase modifying factor 1
LSRTTLCVVVLASSAFADEGAGATPCGPLQEGMACVPGGDFIRGSEKGFKDERPRETISLDAFFIDLTEVTVGDYKACIASGACHKAGPNYRGFSESKFPITGVSWFDATDFCRSKGKRLPTEAEWEKAARGTDGRRFPWGDEAATCERAIIKEGDPNGCGRGKVWPVASKAPTLYGLYDMAGNVHEWVNDWYSKSYTVCGDDCRGHNPKGPCGGKEPCPGHDERVVRGGSWFWDATWATTTKRRAHVPGNRPFHHFGFRCAKDAVAGEKGTAEPSAP